MPYSVSVYDTLGGIVPTELTIVPVFYSANAVGGALRAELHVSGGATAIWEVLEWLNYEIVIYNGNNTPVWSGVVMEATVSRQAMVIGASIERMANRVSVIYNYTGAGGKDVQGVTDWAEDLASIGQYGKKEKVLSLSDTKQEVAEAKRNTYLAALKNPIPVFEFDTGDGGARLICVGLWEVTNWQYFKRDTGKEEYDIATDVDHGLGWLLTDNCIGFNDKGIHDLEARLGYFPRDNQIRISGSVDNNTVYTVTGAPDPEKDIYTSYTATTISFDPNDDIRDSSGGFGFLVSGEMIKVSGFTVGTANAANNGYRWIKTAGIYDVEATPGLIVNASAGPSITLEQGHHLSTKEDVAIEKPTTTVTLKSRGHMVAQKFQTTSLTAWPVKEVEINIGVIGEPVDQLRVCIYNNNAGVPGTELAYGLVDSLSFGSNSDWSTVKLTTAVTISPGVDYYIVAYRTGTGSAEDFWIIGLETGTLTAPPLFVFDETAWLSRTPDARMPYRLWELKETSEQIREILTATGIFTSVFVNVSSGIEERAWREGDQKAQYELQKLIDSGTSTGKRILVRTIPNKGIIVYAEDAPSDSDPIYTQYGVLRSAYGDSWEEGVLPAGQMIRLDDLPVHTGYVKTLANVLIQEAEYDVESGQYRLTPWAMDEDAEL